MEHHERFSNVTSGIKNITISVAVVIGGIWSIITLNILKQAELASIDLERKISEFSEVSIEVELSHKILPRETGKNIGIIVEAQITNNGSLPIVLDFQKSPVSISKVSLNEDYRLSATKKYFSVAYSVVEKDTYTEIISTSSRPGTIRKKEFYFEVEDAGLYFVSFSSPMDSEVAKLLEAREIGLDDHEITDERFVQNEFPRAFMAQKYIFVP